MSVRFIDEPMALAIHENQLALHGGLAGVRDRGGLLSALAQPQASFGGQDLHETIFDKAAAYLYHIARNHPFLDDNKRVGAATAFVFLALNGLVLPDEVDDGPLYDLTIRVATGEATKPEIAAFFQSYFDAPPSSP